MSLLTIPSPMLLTTQGIMAVLPVCAVTDEQFSVPNRTGNGLVVDNKPPSRLLIPSTSFQSAIGATTAAAPDDDEGAASADIWERDNNRSTGWRVDDVDNVDDANVLDDDNICVGVRDESVIKFVVDNVVVVIIIRSSLVEVNIVVVEGDWDVEEDDEVVINAVVEYILGDVICVVDIVGAIVVNDEEYLGSNGFSETTRKIYVKLKNTNNCI